MIPLSEFAIDMGWNLSSFITTKQPPTHAHTQTCFPIAEGLGLGTIHHNIDLWKTPPPTLLFIVMERRIKMS
jgi:hypothetical protein